MSFEFELFSAEDTSFPHQARLLTALCTNTKMASIPRTAPAAHALSLGLIECAMSESSSQATREAEVDSFRRKPLFAAQSQLKSALYGNFVYGLSLRHTKRESPVSAMENKYGEDACFPSPDFAYCSLLTSFQLSLDLHLKPILSRVSDDILHSFEQ